MNTGSRFVSSFASKLFLVLVFFPCIVTTTATAESISSYAAFAGHSIVGTSTITANGGLIGSNGDLFLAGVKAEAVRGGGSLFARFGGIDTTGDVTVNGHAVATFFGDIKGSLHVGKDANLTAKVGGNIIAGGYVKTSGATAGSIFAGSTISATGGVGGSLHPFSGVLPPAFSTIALPSAHAFSSGGPSFILDTFASQTLAPGSYGDLVLIGSNTVNLSSGNYFFNDIRSIGAFVTFNFNSSAGPINIFVKDSVYLYDPEMKLNNQLFHNITSADASQVYWEVHGNFRADFANVLGTVYTPYRDIQLMKLTSVKGVAIAGQDLITDGATFLQGAASPTLAVPEPSTLALAASAAIGLVLVGRRTTARRGARMNRELR